MQQSGRRLKPKFLPLMTETSPPEPVAEPWIDVVRRKMGAMRFGSVQLVIHEGRVTQVESTEKTRLAEPVSGGGASAPRKK
jgi:hypothetical protein